ncbi:MAG: hypothetical protein ACI4SG_00710 [Oligosphaeraceae bacterium]
MTSASIAIQDLLLSLLTGEETGPLHGLAISQQIRPSSDQQDPPMGEAAVIVDASDQGSHLGLPGRVLVDVSAQVEVRTSLAEDKGMEHFRAISQAVHAILEGIRTDHPSATGWDIRHVSPWTEGAVAQDSLYRYQTFSATFLLQAK